jgi:hypothetical protein
MVIFLMSANKPDKDNAVVVLNSNDQSVVIAFDIEYHSILSHKTGVSVNSFDVRWSSP